MHSPKTVAHEIGFIWGKNKLGFRRRIKIVTIWHVDPEKNSLGCRDDDSCGWFAPPYTEEEKDKIQKLAKDQYGQIMARQAAIHEGKSYASVCYNQDIYGAIYWSWRALKAMGKKGWQYGKPLSVGELDLIYSLATNPVDNFQSHKIINYEQFETFFFMVWRSFRRFNRPWYKHPRWHISHWEIQFHPLQNLKRRYWDKCCKCGNRGFKGAAMGNWEGDKIWHAECDDSIKYNNSLQ